MKTKTKKVLSLFLSLMLVVSFFANFKLISSAASYDPQVVVSLCNSKVGTSYQSGYCLRFVREMFQAAYGFRSSACCAHKYGSSYVDSTSRNNIPLGASVFFAGSKKTCGTCGNKCGHIGIYVGNDSIVHVWGGKVVKYNISQVTNAGYTYRGWGWHGNVALKVVYSETQYTSTNPDSYTYPTRTLKQTSPVMSGSDVAWVQAVLKKLGYNISIDGKYGPNTASIVKQFQSAYGLTVDGYCGPKTREKLLELWNAMKHTTHNYECKSITLANCTQSGKRVYVCSCGASYTETIAALGHSFPTQWVVDQVATCTQCGKEHRTCTRCGAIEYATLPYKHHTESDWITDKDATCTQDGSKHKECTVCGKILETGKITALGHLKSIFFSPATCTENGVEPGCLRCGEGYKIIPASGHNKSLFWKINKSATVNAPGSQYKECTECGKVLETAVIPQLAPETPDLVSVANTTSGVKFTWSETEGADNYIVYRRAYNTKTKKWGGWTRIADDVTATSYVDKTAKSGYYRYTVRAVNEGGTSGYDANGIKTYFLATPKVTSTANTNSAITVKWGKVTGATGYIVYRKTGNGKWQNLGKTTGTSFTDKTAKAGVTYRYTVRAYYGSYLSSFVANGYAVRRLTTPTLKSVTSSKSGVTFNWNKVAGATGYNVYRKTGNGGWQKIATVKGTSTVKYLDKTAKKGVTYKYTVKAYYGTSTSYYNAKGLTIKDKY